MVAQNTSADLARRMMRLQTLMARSAQTHSSLQICASTKWKGTSHVKKMRKSALSRNKVLQDIVFKFNNRDPTDHCHFSLGNLKRPKEDSVTNNQSRTARSDPNGRIVRFHLPTDQTEQKHRISSFHAQLLSLVKVYQRSRKVEALGGDHQPRIMYV